MEKENISPELEWTPITQLEHLYSVLSEKDFLVTFKEYLFKEATRVNTSHVKRAQ